VLAENKLGELGDWDRDILREELRELVLLDREFDLEITGFDTIEIENLTRLETDRDLDRLPEPLLTPVTRRGDRWEMGDRIAACGDALRAEDVALLMGAGSARAAFLETVGMQPAPRPQMSAP